MKLMRWRYTDISTRPAFTIIELMLSMTFISLMILMIGMTVIQLGNTYRQGVSIRDVNKVGDLIIGDMQNTINSSGKVLCAVKYADKDKMSLIKKNDDSGGDEDDEGNTSTVDYDCRKLGGADQEASGIIGAAICTGKYSYLWNYGHALRDPNKFGGMTKLFRYRSNGVTKLARLIKVEDKNGEYCKNNADLFTLSPTIYGNNDMALADKNSVIELIESNDRELALHSFSVVSNNPDVNTGQSFHEIEFVLGTFKDKLLMTNNAQCKSLAEAKRNKYKSDGTIDETEKASEFDLNYCAVNKFNFAVRAVKGKGVW